MTLGQEQAILYLQQLYFNATSEAAKDCWYRALSKLLDNIDVENSSEGENVH